MKEKTSVVSLAIGGLAVVNVALAAALWTRSAEPAAYAQAGGRADVITVATHSLNNTAGPIIMLDTSSGQMLLLRPDRVSKSVKLFDRRNAGDDLGRL